jgi:enterochelin esterase family protein
MIQAIPRELTDGQLTPERIRAFVKRHTFPLVADDTVTFIYEGAADHVEIRHWVYGLPSSLPMARIGDSDIWCRVMEFPFGSRIEYKYGVVRQGHEEWLLDPLNPDIAHDPFGGNSVVKTSGYKVPDWIHEQPQVPRGRIETVPVTSKTFGEVRDVRVWLPSSFRDWRRYRLLMVHDGDDYVKYSRLLTVLDNLGDALEIPPLVVALTNPGDRLVEYADDPRHREHLVNEVLPELQSRYPLINQASGRCLMGASFGAVASLSTAWHCPDVFGSLLLQSGSFAFTDIGDHSRSPVFDRVVEFMNAFRRDPGLPARRMFVSCGVYESLIYENRSLVPFLLEQGIEVKYVEARDGHNWENWRDRLRDGLSWLFPGPLWFTYL